MTTKPLICITSGEPAGIGPDICLDLISSPHKATHNLLIIGDVKLLAKRAALLNKPVELIELSASSLTEHFPALNPNQLAVLHVTCKNHECIGVPDKDNAPYVYSILDTAVHLCKNGISNTIVTAPINKDILNSTTHDFKGHTEYFAQQFNVAKVVMMLANDKLNVALATTHLPLARVPDAITQTGIDSTLKIIHRAFDLHFKIKRPKIAVCGLNPHAGENGYLGREEIEIINPVIQKWQQQGYAVYGSFAADTIFTRAHQFDLILAMYHDQGLPVLKYSGFETGVNVTLGLPIIRTSVDHGTALDLAGTGLAKSSSLQAALNFAVTKMHGTALCKDPM